MFLRVAARAIFGSSGPAEGGGGIALRAAVIASAFFLAAGVAGSVSLSEASEARAEPDPTTSEDPNKNDSVEDRDLNESPEDPYHQVVDDSAEERFSAPGWDKHPAGPGTYGEEYATADPSAGAAGFRVRIPKDDHYSVYARWPAQEDNSSAVRFQIPTASGAKSDEVDQGLDAGFWVRIGAYEMEKGERLLRVSGDPGREGRAVADAVMVIGDVLVGRDGRTASYANPDELAPDESVDAAAAGEPTLSTMHHNGSTNRRDVVRRAKRHLGTPYGHNRCRNNVREDCSCLTKLVYEHFGRGFPDSPVRQWRMKAGDKVYRKANLRRGNLVFHDLNRDGELNDHYRDHVSIWAGNGNIVHASSYFDRVVTSEEKHLRGYWGGKRFRLP